MFKKVFLFITAIFVATSASTGYDSTDSLKGDVNPATFLDWFSHAEKYVHIKGPIIHDLIPAIFLLIQVIFFFQDRKKLKGLFALLALVVNLIGVFLLIQNAYPMASQISGWTPEKLPADWIAVKDAWIDTTGLYGLTGLVGWLFFTITFFVGEVKWDPLESTCRHASLSIL